MTALAHTMLEYIANRDHRLMRCVNNWRAPRWVRLWMICATRGGDGWLWYLMALAILLFGGPERWAAVGAAGSGTCRSHLGAKWVRLENTKKHWRDGR